jgi:hypothetical protein
MWTAMFSPFKRQLYKSASSDQKKIRIGLMLNDANLIPVFAEVVKDLRAAEFVDLCLVVVRKKPPLKTKSNLQRILGLHKHITNNRLRATLTFRLYSILDNFYNRRISRFDEISVEELIKGIPVYEVEPIEKGFSDYFPEQDVDFVKRQNLDVLLRFGFRILRGEILNSATCGIWSYHHGDPDFYRGSPPYFWEMVEGASLNGAILQILNEKLDEGRVLVKGRFAAEKGISVKRGKVVPYMGSQHFVIDQLRRLHSMGWTHFADSLEPPHPFKGKREIYRSPTNIEMCRWIARLVVEKIRNRLNRRETVSHWRIGIRRREEAFMERLKDGLVEKDYHWFESPNGHFWADPVLCDVAEKTYLFFEDYIYEKQRAVIACAEVTDDFKLSNIRTVLDTGSHASFPFVFTDGTEFYMVPETYEEGTVSLYRAVSFPHQWEKVKTILDLPCVDTVVWKQNNLWWLSTSHNFNHGHAHTGLLYSSDSLLGQWKLHPEAPFAPDARYARNAGPILSTKDGQTYRVSQRAEFSYGSSISFHKICELNELKYEESLQLTVRPAASSTMRGNHSFALSEKFEVVDGVWNELLSDVATQA